MLAEHLRRGRHPVPAWVVELAAVTRRWSTVEPTGSLPGPVRLAEPPLLLDLDQVGDLLGLARRTVERRVADGLLPAVREGGSVRVRRVDLEAYVAGLEPAVPSFSAMPRQGATTSASTLRRVQGDGREHRNDDVA